ncbi:DUF3817 domain-containing protein [Lysinibacillus sp. NPDC097287]|uniref:DUF3817 domain-containing protein n=1 Tax=Lysinibacillus sp. NPDC097287 TaxID=3364144 RepID=UPI0038150EC9
MKKSIALSVFRIFGILDGISFLFLLCVAMPLKYMADMPMIVTIAGSVHGYIFVVYIITIIIAQIFVKWRFYWSVLALAAAWVPGGNIVLDIYIKKNKEKFLGS